MGNLLVVVILGSGAMGLVLLWWPRWRRAPQLARLGALTFALLAILLLGQANSDVSIQWQWIEEMDTVGLSLDAPGIYLVAMVYGLLAITLARRADTLQRPWQMSRTQGCDAAEPSHPEDGPPWTKRGPPSRTVPYRPGLLYLLCALIAAASTVDHFLARVVLLDTISLYVTVLLHLTLQPSDPFPTLRRYITFRVGDLALLLMVILVWRATGAWDIGVSLAGAQSLPIPQLAPILLGGLLAVWVKLGLPPFHHWLEEGSQTAPAMKVWLTSAALPLLGTYLLYRMRPLLASAQASGYLLVAGVAIALWALGRIVQSDRARSRYLAGWLVLHGALGLILVGTSAMSIFLLSFLPIRAALCVFMSSQVDTIDAQPYRVYGAGRDIVRSLSVVVRAAGWFEERVDSSVQGVVRGVAWLARATGRFDERALEGLIQGVARGITSLGRWLQGVHSGRLRRNLWWASIALFALALVSSLWLL
jgi:hypothetical protein